MTKKEMKLGAFFMIPGHHVAAWRHPKAEAENILSFDFIKRLAQTAERGKFDMIFLADGYASGHGDSKLSSQSVFSILHVQTTQRKNTLNFTRIIFIQI